MFAATTVVSVTSIVAHQSSRTKGCGDEHGLFKNKDFSFSKLGIGGLDRQFEDIFRRAFSSRVFPKCCGATRDQTRQGYVASRSFGTGKTLIARQIGKMLNGKEPVIVNGPEVMSKYVGQSEENIRNLFIDAEKEYKAPRGDGICTSSSSMR